MDLHKFGIFLDTKQNFRAVMDLIATPTPASGYLIAQAAPMEGQHPADFFGKEIIFPTDNLNDGQGVSIAISKGTLIQEVANTVFYQGTHDRMMAYIDAVTRAARRSIRATALVDGERVADPRVETCFVSGQALAALAGNADDIDTGNERGFIAMSREIVRETAINRLIGLVYDAASLSAAALLKADGAASVCMYVVELIGLALCPATAPTLARQLEAGLNHPPLARTAASIQLAIAAHEQLYGGAEALPHALFGNGREQGDATFLADILCAGLEIRLSPSMAATIKGSLCGLLDQPHLAGARQTLAQRIERSIRSSLSSPHHELMGGYLRQHGPALLDDIYMTARRAPRYPVPAICPSPPTPRPT